MISTARRTALSLLLAAGAASASAGVITTDGVSFTSSWSDNVLTVEIDAAGRSGGWSSAQYLDALAIKTVGSFTGVTMTTSTGAGKWTLSSAELKAAGCASTAAPAGGSYSRLCFKGAPIALDDNMVFNFSFEGDVNLSAPHLKVHFTDASGRKVGSLLSRDFPLTTETLAGGGTSTPAPAPAPAPEQTPVPVPETKPALPEELTPLPENVTTKPDTGTPAELPGGVEHGEHGQAPAAVPEPESLALLAAGLGALGFALRRKRADKRS